jgi:hypothetical protein
MLTSHRARATIVLGLTTLLCGVASAQAPENLLANPGLEGDAPGQVAPGWSPVSIGVPATFSVDAVALHAGRSSQRISAAEVTRSYVKSDAIAVAPGETVRASVWVKCEGVPKDQGTVIVIGNFADANGHNEAAMKFDVAKPAKADWQQVTGSLVAPPGSARFHLRVGFSYSMGTVWVDDARVWTDAPVVARIDKADGRLSPAMGAVPVTVLNRSGERGAAQVDVVLARPGPKGPAGKPGAKQPGFAEAADKVTAATTRPGAVQRSLSFDLTGEPTQTVRVPIDVSLRGEADLGLVLARGGKPVFAEYRSFTVPYAIVVQPPVPTHWVVEDGPPHVEGRVELALSDKERDGAKVSVRVEDKSGTTVAAWHSAGPLLADAVLEPDVPCPGATEGDYTLVTELTPKQGKPIRVERKWSIIPRRLARVTINEAGYPVYDGKAIFPIGMFNGTRWEDMQKAGMTVAHSYNAVRVADVDGGTDAKAYDFIEAAGKHGMNMCFMVPLKLAERGEWDAFRRRIRMFRNHPALLCWDEEEGLARGDWKPEVLARVRQILNEEDPNHPFMVGDSRDVIGRMGDRSNFFPVEHMDLGMWWWYPFPLKSIGAGALEGDEGATATELVLPSFLTRRNTQKPVWVGVQSYKKNKDSRYPTPQEYRAQAYAALCAGAQGLMYYGGGVTGGLQLNPEEAHWKELQGIVREVGSRADFWMEPKRETPAFAPETALVSTMIKRHGGKAVFVAVNRGVKPVAVTFDVPSLSGQAAVVGEDRSVRVEGGQLKDRFEGLGVHVYELGARP